MNEHIGQCKDCVHRDYYGDCYLIKQYVRVRCDCEGPIDGYEVADNFGCLLFKQKKRVVLIDYINFHYPDGI